MGCRQTRLGGSRVSFRGEKRQGLMAVVSTQTKKYLRPGSRIIPVVFLPS